MEEKQCSAKTSWRPGRKDCDRTGVLLFSWIACPHWLSGYQRGRPRLYGLQHYQEVSRVYAEAWHRGDPPTKAVAGWGNVSDSTAAKWVSKARELGFLGPTTKGRPGIHFTGQGSAHFEIRATASGEFITPNQDKEDEEQE